LDFSILDKYGIPRLPFSVAKSEEEAALSASKIGFPVAMKLISGEDTALHKTDIGGVVLNVASQGEAKGVYADFRKRFGSRLTGVLVQKMATKARGSVELIVGGKKDAQFGQLVMLGLGGIFVEAYRDVTFRVCPISSEDAFEMIHELRSFQMLMGIRGGKPADLQVLAGTIVKVSRLLEKENPSEFDINPLLVDERGCVALDVRFLQ